MNPGATTRPVRIDDSVCGDVAQVADSDDGVVSDCHVGGEGGLAGAVDDPATFENDAGCHYGDLWL